MKFEIGRTKDFLLLCLLFVLPWQTRLIYQSTFIGNDFWEYGSLFLYGTEILLGVVTLLFLIDFLKNKSNGFFLKYVDKTRMIKIVAGLFFVVSLYIIVSVGKMVTWQYLNWVIYSFCLGFVILNSRLSFNKLALVVWGGGVLQGVVAIWQFLNQHISANKWLGIALQDPHKLGVAVIELGDERWLRAYGAFGWPNSLGIYLATVFILGIIIKGSGRIVLLGQTIILTGLFLSFSRGAWLAGVFGLIILGLSKYKEKYFWQQIGIYALTFLLLLVIFKPLVFSRLNFQNRLEKVSLSERTTQWVESQQVFTQNYFVGTGPGNYTAVLHKLNPKYFVGDLKPVHNIYLLFMAEWGIFGVLLLLYFIKITKKTIDWMFAPLVVLLIAGLFDHWSLSSHAGLIFFALLVGLSVKKSIIDTKVE